MPHLTTYEELNAAMACTALKDRNIGQFCGFFIYGGECTTADCPRFHTQDLDKMRWYLGDPKVKSVLCEKGAHCQHFVCRFGHDYDHDILGHSDPENRNQTDFEYDEEHRDKARQYWREAKQYAYNQELLSGSRQPKNKREHALLTRLMKDQNANHQTDFPTLSTNPPVPAPWTPAQMVGSQSYFASAAPAPQHAVPVDRPESEKLADFSEVARQHLLEKAALSAQTEHQQPQYLNPVQPSQYTYQDMMNLRYQGLMNTLQANPGYLADPVVNELFQLCRYAWGY